MGRIKEVMGVKRLAQHTEIAVAVIVGMAFILERVVGGGPEAGPGRGRDRESQTPELQGRGRRQQGGGWVAAGALTPTPVWSWGRELVHVCTRVGGCVCKTNN